MSESRRPFCSFGIDLVGVSEVDEFGEVGEVSRGGGRAAGKGDDRFRLKVPWLLNGRSLALVHSSPPSTGNERGVSRTPRKPEPVRCGMALDFRGVRSHLSLSIKNFREADGGKIQSRYVLDHLYEYCDSHDQSRGVAHGRCGRLCAEGHGSETALIGLWCFEVIPSVNILTEVMDRSTRADLRREKS